MTQETQTPASGQPVPNGFRLLHSFRLYDSANRSAETAGRFEWSPDGRFLAVPSPGRISLWEMSTGQLYREFKGKWWVGNVAWAPDGETLVARLTNGSFVTLNSATGEQGLKFSSERGEPIFSLALSPDGQTLAVGYFQGTIELWDMRSQRLTNELLGDTWAVIALAWSKDGRTLVEASNEGSIRLWDVAAGAVKAQLRGNDRAVYAVAWAPEGNILASSSSSPTVKIWSPDSQEQISSLEGHTGAIYNLAFSFDNRYFVSKSFDGSVRLWRCENWDTLAILEERANSFYNGLAFHPKSHVIATYDSEQMVVRVWELDVSVLDATAPVEKSVHYTTVKVALVGDSGVGKTGLGWRIAHGEFKEHPSTHGQQFWVIDELGKRREDGTECEAVLWDLAGQPDYRLVHSLFLDDVDLALVVFDPANREKPLSGVEFWLKQLSKREGGARRSVLVGARVDRGTATLTEKELEEFCRQKGVTGGYVATSAMRGDGLPELMRLIKSQIPWDEMPATITTATFKRIKEYVLSLKEGGGQKAGLLVGPAELRARLVEKDAAWKFTDAEMMTAVRHLATHGYVTVLRASSGDESILLAPDVLVNLAASLVLEARRNPMGLGVLEEDRLLRGGYTFPELNGLAEVERETLLDAATALFLKHNLCFRETFNEQTFLVFPSLINEKRPRLEDLATADDVSYRVTGAVENVYAALVVLLGYTNTFTRKHQWQNQAQYELGKDEVCGFRQAVEHEGEVELVLYYGEQTPREVRQLFQGLFERFLKRREVSIVRFPSLTCTKCGKLQEQRVVRRRTAFAEALVWVKSILRERGGGAAGPSCFVSYAWGDAAHEKWVMTLAKDLRDSGIGVVLDRWHNPPGGSITEFVERIESSDYVVAVGSPEYLKKYAAKDEDRVVGAEFRLIGTRLRMREEVRRRVIPALREGDEQTSFPPLLRDSVFVDFRSEKDYFVNLFDLILTVYRIPFDHPNLEGLREKMSR
jgi:small GTP-binding protein